MVRAQPGTYPLFQTGVHFFLDLACHSGRIIERPEHDPGPSTDRPAVQPHRDRLRNLPEPALRRRIHYIGPQGGD